MDGESNFEFTAAIVHFLAENERIPEMIVIGVDSGSDAQRTQQNPDNAWARQKLKEMGAGVGDLGKENQR